jgi:biopolymer transport protein ExbB/TolQ
MNSESLGAILVFLHLGCPIAAAIIHFMIVTERRSGRRGRSTRMTSRQSSSSPDTIYRRAFAHQEALRRARQEQERAELRAEREKERAERRAEQDRERAELRAERDAAYEARGITPGPMAWFWALPDLCQAILMGLALAVPLGGAAVLIFRATSLAGSP